MSPFSTERLDSRVRALDEANAFGRMLELLCTAAGGKLPRAEVRFECRRGMGLATMGKIPAPAGKSAP
jgi:hypothetical protein